MRRFAKKISGTNPRLSCLIANAHLPSSMSVGTTAMIKELRAGATVRSLLDYTAVHPVRDVLTNSFSDNNAEVCREGSLFPLIATKVRPLGSLGYIIHSKPIPYGSVFARETGTPIALSAKGAPGVESATIHSSSSTSGTGKVWFERPSMVPSQIFSRIRRLRSFTIFFASASANSSASA